MTAFRDPITWARTILGRLKAGRLDVLFRATSGAGDQGPSPSVRDRDQASYSRVLASMAQGAKNLDVGCVQREVPRDAPVLNVVTLEVIYRAASLAPAYLFRYPAGKVVLIGRPASDATLPSWVFIASRHWSFPAAFFRAKQHLALPVQTALKLLAAGSAIAVGVSQRLGASCLFSALARAGIRVPSNVSGWPEKGFAASSTDNRYLPAFRIFPLIGSHASPNYDRLRFPEGCACVR